MARTRVSLTACGPLYLGPTCMPDYIIGVRADAVDEFALGTLPAQICDRDPRACDRVSRVMVATDYMTSQ